MTATIRTRAGLAGLILALVPAAASTDDAPSLKEIMQGLREDTVRITNGLLTDDFELVAEGADAIADHPKISVEDVQLVAAELGDEISTFKVIDTLVHDLAVEVSAAARTEDRVAMVTAYQEMFEACLACHYAYQERVAAALQRGSESADD